VFAETDLNVIFGFAYLQMKHAYRSPAATGAAAPPPAPAMLRPCRSDSTYLFRLGRARPAGRPAVVRLLFILCINVIALKTRRDPLAALCAMSVQEFPPLDSDPE